MISFEEQYPDVAKCWHPTKNKMKPSDVTSGMRVKAYFICEVNPNHISCVVIHNKRSGRCDLCARRKVTKENGFGHSYPVLVKEWDYEKNGIETPYSFTKNSPNSVYWKCKNGHSFKNSIQNRCLRGQKCRDCYHPKTTSENRLSIKYPDIAKEWCYKENHPFTPEQIPYGSKHSFFWKCPKKGHVWECTVQGRTIYQNACTKCITHGYSKSSVNWLETISKKYDLDIQHALNGKEYKFKLKNGKVVKVDGFCRENNTVYEYMGCYWHGHLSKDCFYQRKYKEDDIHPTSKKSYKTMYEDTMKRIDLIKKEGYKVVVMWGCVYKNGIKRKHRIDIIDDIQDLDGFMSS